ncbi:PilZ domain-containing protein [Kiloniella sp.]|uniref:PilZ domain-containing protein n=1 Tax=Kiloniella sp. TaxID=1938587 RepID=UPI003A9559EF
MYQEVPPVSLQRLMNRRHAPRHMVSPGTKVRLTAFDNYYDCEVLDLSFCGARLLLDIKLPIGSEIIISHNHCGQVFGTVKWNSSQEIGLELGPGVGRLLTRCNGSEAVYRRQ